MYGWSMSKTGIIKKYKIGHLDMVRRGYNTHIAHRRETGRDRTARTDRENGPRGQDAGADHENGPENRFPGGEKNKGVPI